MRPEYDKLHQKKVAHRRARDRAELCNEDIGRERRKAEMHHNNGDDPAIQDYDAVLDQLLEVIISPAPKYPELI